MKAGYGWTVFLPCRGPDLSLARALLYLRGRGVSVPGAARAENGCYVNQALSRPCSSCESPQAYGASSSGPSKNDEAGPRRSVCRGDDPGQRREAPLHSVQEAGCDTPATAILRTVIR